VRVVGPGQAVQVDTSPKNVVAMLDAALVGAGRI
jgi:hypothetical protein